MSGISILVFFLFYFTQEGAGLIMPTSNPNTGVDLTFLVNHVISLEQKVKDQETKSADLEQQVKILTGDLKTTQLKLQETRSELQSLKSNNSVTVQELDSVKQEVVAMKIELEMASNERNAQISDIQTLKQEVLMLIGNNTGKGMAVVSPKQDLTPTSVNVTDKNTTSEIQGLRNEVLSLRRNATWSIQELFSTKQELAAMKIELDMTANDANIAGSEVRKLKIEMMSLKMEVNSSLDNLDHDVDSNSADIHHLQQDVLKSQQLLMNNSRLHSNLATKMAAVQSQLNTVMDKISTLEAVDSSPKIGFHVCYKVQNLHLDPKTPDVQKNKGEGYNSTTDKFIAPVSGTYTFSVVPSTKATIMKNDISMQTSNTSIAYINKGDQVWTKPEIYTVKHHGQYTYQFCFIGSLLSDY